MGINRIAMAISDYSSTILGYDIRQSKIYLLLTVYIITDDMGRSLTDSYHTSIYMMSLVPSGLVIGKWL